MTAGASLLVESYVEWITKSVSAELIDEGLTEITTPFLDQHNDHLQIYAEQRAPDFYLLTDDGYIVAQLKSSGVERKGSHRKELIEGLIGAYGVKFKGRELQTFATSKDLGQRIHSLIQAMLSVDDMFVLAQERTSSIFFEDVARFLDERDVRYTARAKFSGKSGLDHMADFVIPKSRAAPERIVSLVNTPRMDRITSLLFAVGDTRAMGHQETAYYAVINDKKRDIPSDIVHAFEEYEVRMEPWSRREQMIETLAV